jgi:hypothetical protein
MSDTPETDAVWQGGDTIKQVMTSRRLERERDEAKHEIEGWSNKWNYAVEMAARAEVERDEARGAIKNYYGAKGRYNSQIAAAKMFELVGLPIEYPANYLKKEGAK